MRWRWWCGMLGLAMNRRAPSLSRRYGELLRDYRARPEETLLQQAYEVGRKAITRGLGVLDMARIHQQALASCLLPPSR